MKKMNNFALIIPIRLSSKRFKNKILEKVLGYSIFEHVYMRSKKAGLIDNKDMYVATSDKILLKKKKFKKVNFFLTKLKHKSGSSRASEVAKKVKKEFYVIIFGDEPLILPEDIRKFISNVKNNSKYDFFNAVCPIKKDELSKKSIVKCITNNENEIIKFDRVLTKKNIKKRIYKSVGIFAFKRKLLLNFKKISNINKSDIEQNSILMNSIKIKAVKISHTPCSVNTKEELFLVKKIFKEKKQKKIVNEYLS